MKSIMIRPAEQRIVVLPDEKKEKITGGGIILTTVVEDTTPEIATVIAVGTGEKDRPMLYSKGQRVIYSQYSGVEVKLNIVGADSEKVYKVMDQLDVMAIIEEG